MHLVDCPQHNCCLGFLPWLACLLIWLLLLAAGAGRGVAISGSREGGGRRLLGAPPRQR